MARFGAVGGIATDVSMAALIDDEDSATSAAARAASGTFTGERTWTAKQTVQDSGGKPTVLGDVSGNQSRAAGIYPSFDGTMPGVELANGTVNWRVVNHDGNLQFKLAGDSDWKALLHPDGLLRTRGPVFSAGYSGTQDPKQRIPFNSGVTIDGSKLDATNLANKVGMQNSVLFKGGFSGEVGFGAPDPGFLFGGNDFIQTGTATGDLAGVSDVISRLTELHLDTPGADVNSIRAFQVDIGLGATAVGAHVGWMTGVWLKGPTKSAEATGAVVDNTATLYVNSPEVGVATNEWAVFVSGQGRSRFGGDILMNDDPGQPKTLNAYEGTVRGLTFTVGPTSLTSAARLTAKSKADAEVVGWFQGRGGQSVNILNVGVDSVVRSFFDKRGRLGMNDTSVPADADIANGQIVFYVDSTSGAMKLMLKAKDAGGTVRTGQVALA